MPPQYRQPFSRAQGHYKKLFAGQRQYPKNLVNLLCDSLFFHEICKPASLTINTNWKNKILVSPSGYQERIISYSSKIVCAWMVLFFSYCSNKTNREGQILSGSVLRVTYTRHIDLIQKVHHNYNLHKPTRSVFFVLSLTEQSGLKPCFSFSIFSHFFLQN